MGKYVPLTVLTVLLHCSTSLINAQDICATPTNKEGNCKVITQCPPLLRLLQKQNRTPQETTFLRNSQCGSEGRYPKVCCETETRPNPVSNTCTTPNQTPGVCKDLYQCPALLNLFNGPKPLPASTVTFLRQSQCQGPARVNVCCGNVVQPVETVNVDSLLPTRAECGISADEDRIFGGNETLIDQYPWMALIEYTTKRNTISTSCSASLINKRYLVTAGHCVVGDVLTLVGTPTNIRLGEFDKSTGRDCVQIGQGESDCNEEPVIIEIEKIIPHPEYLPKTQSQQRNDIALIRMSRDAAYTDFIKPVCLPNTDITVNLKSKALQLVVAGWGTTEQKVPSQRKLHVFIPFVELPECIEAYRTNKLSTNIWDKQLCAGGEPGKDSCRGDSGGPLVHSINGKYELTGVVSYGPTPCALPGVPGVYTNVYRYLNWIKGEIKP